MSGSRRRAGPRDLARAHVRRRAGRTAARRRVGGNLAVAKVGFFLEQHRAQLMVEDHHLDRLRAHVPAHPMYLDRGKRESGRLLAGWNLVVPERVIERTWAEVA